jgi:hypothetical protein
MTRSKPTSLFGWMFVAISLLLLAAASPRVALAKTDVVVTDLKLPEDRSSKEFEKSVRSALSKAAKPLDFGHVKRVEITVRLTEFSIETSDELVRVTCTLVGRLKGGGTARSHFSFGDKPGRRKSLEKQVLKMASEGVLGRLAEMTRVKEALEKKKQDEATAKDKDKDGAAPDDADEKRKHRG